METRFENDSEMILRPKNSLFQSATSSLCLRSRAKWRFPPTGDPRRRVPFAMLSPRGNQSAADFAVRSAVPLVKTDERKLFQNK